MQDTTSTLNLCSGGYLGNLFLGSDDSSDYAEADLSSTDMASGTVATPPTPIAGFRYYPPLELELIDEFNGPPDGFPMAITEVLVTGGRLDARETTSRIQRRSQPPLRFSGI